MIVYRDKTNRNGLQTRFYVAVAMWRAAVRVCFIKIYDGLRKVYAVKEPMLLLHIDTLSLSRILQSVTAEYE